MDYKMVKQVQRVPKKGTGFLKIMMIFFGVLFLLAGIMLDRGMMLPAFLMAGLYLIFEVVSDRGYDYTMEGHQLTIDIIRGKKYRQTVQELNLENLVIVAPAWHEAVEKYKKRSGYKIKKYDYTSYDDRIPYYTMIIKDEGTEIKLLLDLEDDMLNYIKKMAPEKVILNKMIDEQ